MSFDAVDAALGVTDSTDMGVADATGFEFGGYETDPPELPELPDLGSLLLEADPLPLLSPPGLSEHMIIASPTDPPKADVEIAVGRPEPWPEKHAVPTTDDVLAEPRTGLGVAPAVSAIAMADSPDQDARDRTSDPVFPPPRVAGDEGSHDQPTLVEPAENKTRLHRPADRPSALGERSSLAEPRVTALAEPRSSTLGEPSAPPMQGGATALQALEALLFAAHEPLAPGRLGSLIGDLDGKAVRKLVEQLNAEYDRSGRTFRIEEIAGGFQLLTRPEFHPWLKKLFRSRAEGKLSQTALLTLAIIAYKQPIKRVDIESIRGTACGEVIRTLMEKGLVKIVGREESLGRPLLYGTTKKFLQAFGLGGLKDLPKVEELNKP